jgi:hypothetical protein
LKRLLKICELLHDANIVPGILKDTRDEIAAWFAKRITALLATDTKFAGYVSENDVIDVRTVEVNYSTSGTTDHGVTSVKASERNLATLYATAKRRLDGEVANRIITILDADGNNPRLTKVKIFTAADHAHTMIDLQGFAQEKIKTLVDNIPSFAAMSEAHQQRINRLQGGENERILTPFMLPSHITTTKKRAATGPKHYYKTDGTIEHEPLNVWEKAVLEAEQQRPDFVAWVRNIDRARWALGIIRPDTAKPFYPDLLVFRKKPNGEMVLDILDPHLTSFTDSTAKAKGLAKYAESQHGAVVGRIEAIRVDSNGLIRRLDLKKPEVRQKVLNASDSHALDNLYDTIGDTQT